MSAFPVEVLVGQGQAGEIADHYVLRLPLPVSLSLPLVPNNDGVAEMTLVSSCCLARIGYESDRTEPLSGKGFYLCTACAQPMGPLTTTYFMLDFGPEGLRFMGRGLLATLEALGDPLAAALVHPALVNLCEALVDLTRRHRILYFPHQRALMSLLAAHYGVLDLVQENPVPLSPTAMETLRARAKGAA